MAKKKYRKQHPQPPQYYWYETDNCWQCDNRNNCGNCKFLKEYVISQKEKRRRKEKENIRHLVLRQY